MVIKCEKIRERKTLVKLYSSSSGLSSPSQIPGGSRVAYQISPGSSGEIDVVMTATVSFFQL